MRSKEEAKDYRYFPEPDLPPFIITRDKIEEIKKTIPELPKNKRMRFMKEYGLTQYDASVLASDKDNADYAEERFKAWQDKNKKPVANWLIGPLAAIAGSRNLKISEIKIPAKDILCLIELVEKKQVISNLAGKAVLEEMASSKKTASEIIEEKNLGQISDSSGLEGFVDDVIKENPSSVESFKSGRENALMFLVGQVMKKSKGKANPKVAQDILRRRLLDE
jgi:aspartyl-tRNA(Asn)/glutamyl-tRNA(Gln) amidotransferase subunit B